MAGASPGMDPSSPGSGASGEYKKVVAQIESGGNPNARNKDSGAAGMYQFIPSTWKAYAPAPGASPYDPQAANQAFERFTTDNRNSLAKSIGRTPNDAEMYLAHQQGAGGASKLLSNPNARAADLVGERAVVLNGGRPDMTAGEFANLWTGKYNKFAGMPSMTGSPMPSMSGAQPTQTASVTDRITGRQVPVNPDGTAADIFNPETGQPGAMAFAGSQGGQGPGLAAINQAAPQGQPMPLQGAQGGIPAPRATPNIVRALAAIASDPWLSDSQKSMAMMLAKDQIAKSNPEYGFQVVGDQLYRTDKRSGNAVPMGVSADKTTMQVIGQDEYGNNMYGFVNPVTKQITPVAPQGTVAAQMQGRQQAPQPQAAPSPDGQPPQAAAPADGIPPAPPGINPKIWRDEKTRELARGEKFTESQGKALTFGNRMENSEGILQSLENEGTSRANRLGANIPIIGNSVVSEGFQKFQQAEREFINALLRRESGAVIADSEYNNFSKQYFPQPGDSPDVIAQKRQSRKVAIDAMKKEAGPNYKSPTPAASADGWHEVAPGVRIREKN